jgi:hypothetical protein
MKTRRMVKGFLLGVILSWLMLPWAGYTVPTTINYQGYLTDAGGTPINTTVQITFSLYTTPSGVSTIWSETQNVVVAAGVYSVSLGSANHLNLLFDAQYYLGVKVGTDPEMTPRQILTSVPYAFRAMTADNAGPGMITQVTGGTGLSGGGTSGNVILSIGTPYQLPQGCTSGKIPSWNGSVWICGTDQNSGGTITQITVGGGLSGGGISGNVPISIADLGLSTSKLADGAVTKSKLSSSGGTNGQVLGTDGTNLAWQNDALTLPYLGVASTTQGAFAVTNIASTGTALWGLAADGIGTYGGGNGNSGVGVFGNHISTGNYGQVGTTTAGVYAYGYGNSRGVWGVSQNATGIHGHSDGGYGIFGESTNSTGVQGINTTTGNSGELGHTNAGVHGQSVNGLGAYGESTNSIGVRGINTGTGNQGDLGHTNAGVRGTNSGGNYGELAQTNAGVYGFGNGNSRGVWGQSQNGTGVHGQSTNGYGVFGTNTTTGNFGWLGGNYGVYGSAPGTGDVVNYGGYFSAAGDKGVAVYGIATGTGGTGRPYGGYFVSNGSGAGIGVYGWSAVSPYSGTGVLGCGSNWDFYGQGCGYSGGYGPFTGGHEVKLSEDFPSNIKSGLIVSVSGKTEARRTNYGTISLSSTLPTVKLSKVANDKAVFGVLVNESPLPEDHWYKKKEGERFSTVNALGEGRVLVTNANSNIEAGDYITTSSIPGYGQRQNDDILHSYTLGKATETVDWDLVTETVTFNGNTYKVYLIAVVYTSG